MSMILIHSLTKEVEAEIHIYVTKCRTLKSLPSKEYKLFTKLNVAEVFKPYLLSDLPMSTKGFSGKDEKDMVILLELELNEVDLIDIDLLRSKYGLRNQEEVIVAAFQFFIEVYMEYIGNIN